MKNTLQTLQGISTAWQLPIFILPVHLALGYMKHMYSKDKFKRSTELIDLFGRAPIKKTFGMVLSYNSKLEAIFEMGHNPGFEHALGDTHGGIIATLLDNAGWFTAAVQYETWIATIEMQMRLLKPAGRNDLRATGELVRAGRNFAVTQMKVQTVKGRLVATGSGTFAVTSTHV